jgi:hypothetical protein
MGQVATRRTTQGPRWQLLAGCELRQDERGGLTMHGNSQARPQPVHDVIEITGPDSFELIDRPGNLVNIVGKRTSLELPQPAPDQPARRRGRRLLPAARPGSSDDARLAAFVVAPGQQAGEILHALRAMWIRCSCRVRWSGWSICRATPTARSRRPRSRP